MSLRNAYPHVHGYVFYLRLPHDCRACCPVWYPALSPASISVLVSICKKRPWITKRPCLLLYLCFLVLTWHSSHERLFLRVYTHTNLLEHSCTYMSHMHIQGSHFAVCTKDHFSLRWAFCTYQADNIHNYCLHA